MDESKSPESNRKKYVHDPRTPCKYGAKCYQKNPEHHQKYKHSPAQQLHKEQPRKKIKLDDGGDEGTSGLTKKICFDIPEDRKNTNDEHNVNSPQIEPSKVKDEHNTASSKIEPSEVKDETKAIANQSLNLPHVRLTPNEFHIKEFIKEKFLVEMPSDFYSFWDFCKVLKEKCPQEAFKDVGLTLVGPYDVLAGKFYNIPDPTSDKYLIHWRYFYDPPEFQTVLKGDDKVGFHIGYFRDSPKELPVYLASNCAKTDGIFKIIGDNIFAAVYLYLEDLKKTGDPFKKMHIGRFQNMIKKKADELNLNLSESSQHIRDRNKKIVTRSFSKMGIVVPYNRKTQVGYRDLGISNKQLVKILDNIKKASPDQKQKYLSDLQSILTNVSIATDECDFGTGIELGLNILAHGVDSLDQTASRFLATNYRLIEREEFAKIVEAHMKNRRKGVNLSIL